MGFHADELTRIKKATSGLFKKKARTQIAHKLVLLSMQLELLTQKPEAEADAELKTLLEGLANARHRALANGANGYGDPDWAEAAACESWVQALMARESEAEVNRVNALIHELIDRAR